MNLLVLALLAAATNTQPANNNGNATNTKNTPAKPSAKSKASKPSTQTDAAGNAVPAEDGAAAKDPAGKPKQKKGEDTAAPDAGSPASIVGNSIDAATQIANEATKAAMEEIKRLQGIGGDSAAPSPGTAKLVEAGVAGTAAAAKEVSKAKKKPAPEEASTQTEPVAKPDKKKKPATTEEGAKDGKAFGVKVEGAPQKQ